MVATLILMIAGRGIAQLLTNGVRIQIFYQPYAFIGQGWILLPFSLYIVVFLFIITWLLTRRTAIGMFIESVGINAKASFYSGINEKRIKMLVYTFCGLCAGIASLIDSNIKASDANSIANHRVDAILAVVIGGHRWLAGAFAAGKPDWALVIAITTSMLSIGVPAFAKPDQKPGGDICVLLYSNKSGLCSKITTQIGRGRGMGLAP
jgi:simple sugar transport system permease protein